jgi:hypothetical protein
MLAQAYLFFFEPIPPETDGKKVAPGQMFIDFRLGLHRFHAIRKPAQTRARRATRQGPAIVDFDNKFWIGVPTEYSAQLVENWGSRGRYALPRIAIANPGVDEAISSYKRFPVFNTTLTKDTGRDGDVAQDQHLD